MTLNLFVIRIVPEWNVNPFTALLDVVFVVDKNSTRMECKSARKDTPAITQI